MTETRPDGPYETIKVGVDARGVATVTLDRADKHNAMNAAMIADLSQVAARLGGDPLVRVVVLAAAGRTFCAGGDLGWMRAQAGQDRASQIAEARTLADMLAAWNALPKPVIARVQGPAYGGGIGLMAVSDIVVAAEGTRFGLTETRLGLIPATIGPFVVRRMGEGHARRVFLTAKPFDTVFAQRSGLVSEVCAPEALDETVEAECVAALACAPGAVAAAKALCLSLGGDPVAAHIERTVEALADRWETDEASERIAAFFARAGG
ncbi:methylglutaconyl-CoA hydratase [Amorphus suaedae]